MRVILQPCGSSDANKHFVDTIQHPVDAKRILSLVNSQDKATLTDVFSGRIAIPTWGVTPGDNLVNQKKWSVVEPGDLALFSRSGRIFASAFVAEKVHAKTLALDLWKTNADGETWEFVYFLDEVAYLDIPYSDFNKIVGYKENNVIQGFNVLDEHKSLLVSAALDLESKRYQPKITFDDYNSILTNKFGDVDDLDINRTSKGRLEQGFLREKLFGKKIIAECCMCAREFSVDFLVTAHIKRRADCSLDERKDYKNIVAPMCKGGCDALFEQGYIFVDGMGLIRNGKSDFVSTGVMRMISALIGRKCIAWRSANKSYFESHIDHFMGKRNDV